MNINLRWFYLGILVCILAGLTACNKNSSAPTSQPPSTVSTTDNVSVKRYPFKGKVISVDPMAKSANIDGADIPGFMSAMTMSYEIHPESDLKKLHAGDSITAEVVVDNSDSNNEKYWLENVEVVPSKKP